MCYKYLVDCSPTWTYVLRLGRNQLNVLSPYILQIFADNSPSTKGSLFSIVNVETIQRAYLPSSFKSGLLCVRGMLLCAVWCHLAATTGIVLVLRIVVGPHFCVNASLLRYGIHSALINLQYLKRKETAQVSILRFSFKEK